MTEQVRKPLPESLMKAIRVVVTNEEAHRQERFDAVLLLVTGYGLFEQAESIDPTRFAIPEEQWHEVSGLLTNMAKEASGLSGVNAALGWMNSGPSAYVPDGE